MKLEPQTIPPKELQSLVHTFIKTNGANEINDVLGLMLEVYLLHAPVEKTDLVNTTSLIYRLNKFFFNLEALKGKANGTTVLIIDEGKQECTHN